jgi:probable nitrogen fixation protein
MTTDTLLIADDDPLLTDDFIQELVRQVRALDRYGQYDQYNPAQRLDPFILTRERKRELPLIGDPDQQVVARIEAYYNALAIVIEQRCELPAVSLVHLSHEGFGRVLITVGRLVVLDRTLREVHRFGFASLVKLHETADQALQKALTLIAEHPGAAGR